MFVLGLTGNSGSGKSTVAKILAEKNAYIIDADILARKVLDIDGRAYEETVSFFGSSVLSCDKTINRRALSDIVFSDSEKLATLNEITHKHILNDIYDDIERISQGGSYGFIVIDAPLLFESGLDNVCNAVWAVDADYGKKLARIMGRDGIDRQKAAQRLIRQASPGELCKKADYMIQNDSGLDYLEEQVEELLVKMGI